jgi:hypothetical protein
MKHEMNSVMMMVVMAIRRVMMSTSGEVRVVMVGRGVKVVDDNLHAWILYIGPVAGVGFHGCLSLIFDAISHEVLEVFAQLRPEVLVHE